MRFCLPTLLLFFSLTPGAAAWAGPPAGQVLYQKNCAPCHGANGRKGLSSAHDLTKSNLNAYGRAYLVTNGFGKMPSFKKTLSEVQIQQIVAYSLTLR
ncbi:hypothetical protein GCM10023185_38880 [Hymenobacter saemangeumensis]|uniref:Cytochrome c domain-containing protein n=1 Tax=Hymenobacter saemangeumensis TaxID=1084522 RepID=A0ABP8IQL4_9BACT